MTDHTPEAPDYSQEELLAKRLAHGMPVAEAVGKYVHPEAPEPRKAGWSFHGPGIDAMNAERGWRKDEQAERPPVAGKPRPSEAWIVRHPDGLVTVREKMIDASLSVQAFGGEARGVIYSGEMIGEGGPYNLAATRQQDTPAKCAMCGAVPGTGADDDCTLCQQFVQATPADEVKP